MPQTVFGLPIHPLVVHATVVLVPLTALTLLLAVVWPRFRAWAGWLPLALAAVSVALAPLSTSTGESLEHMVRVNPALGNVAEQERLIEQHAHLGDQLVWWCVGMLLVAAATTYLWRRGRRVGTGLAATVLVLGLGASIGTLVDVALIGHSGAKAAWVERVNTSASGSSAGADGD